jgi:hypothetical protein
LLNVRPHIAADIFQSSKFHRLDEHRENKTPSRIEGMTIRDASGARSNCIIESTTAACMVRRIARICSRFKNTTAWFSPHCLRPQENLFQELAAEVPA